jgi:hypothetical protein
MTFSVTLNDDSIPVATLGRDKTMAAGIKAFLAPEYDGNAFHTV